MYLGELGCFFDTVFTNMFLNETSVFVESPKQGLVTMEDSTEIGYL